MTSETTFAHRLVERFPDLQPVRDEHLQAEDGELLPYLFMGDVAAWLHEQAVTHADTVRDVLDWLEREYTNSDFDIRNLIDVGIIEMLPSVPSGAPVLGLLGPSLRARAEVAGLLATDGESSDS